MLERLENPRDEVTIGLVGKYVEYEDSYKSLKEALQHGGMAHNLKVNIHWIEAEGVVGDERERQLAGYDGILVPGGFGKRGIEGMLNAIRYARERKVPYFGICLGMQTLVIEFARNVCGLARCGFHRVQPRHAPSRDFQAARIEGRRGPGRHHAAGRLALPAGGGQLRLPRLRRRAKSTSATAIATNSTANTKSACRPRACASPAKRPTAPTSRSARLGRPSRGILGCQFHPEFKSKPMEPHPLFKAFIGASYANRQRRLAPVLARNAPRRNLHACRLSSAISEADGRWC